MKKQKVNFAIAYGLVTIIAILVVGLSFYTDSGNTAVVILAVYGLGFFLEFILSHVSLENKIRELTGLTKFNDSGIMLVTLMLLDIACIVIILITHVVRSPVPDIEEGLTLATACLFVILVIYFIRWRCYYRHL